ncbi:MAG: hypothetical protein NZ951_02630 [Dehalococcoidia bacterium]|nr:hypothetical protein [Dehalococcoidia bacterium]MDW8119856.1 hypothetical protein [Chloroflexota bacterium]
MTQPTVRKFGIYLNIKDGKVVRITSPYWWPEAPDWVLVTEEVNAPLTKIRQLVQEKGLYPHPEGVTWGQIPLRE